MSKQKPRRNQRKSGSKQQASSNALLSNPWKARLSQVGFHCFLIAQSNVRGRLAYSTIPHLLENEIITDMYKLKKGKYICNLLHVGFLLGFGHKYKAKCSSETSDDFRRTPPIWEPWILELITDFWKKTLETWSDISQQKI